MTTVVSLAKQSQFELIASSIDASVIGPVMDAVRAGFTESIHSTFGVGAAICLVAAGAAWFLRNPDRVHSEAIAHDSAPIEPVVAFVD